MIHYSVVVITTVEKSSVAIQGLWIPFAGYGMMEAMVASECDCKGIMVPWDRKIDWKLLPTCTLYQNVAVYGNLTPVELSQSNIPDWWMSCLICSLVHLLPMSLVFRLPIALFLSWKNCYRSKTLVVVGYRRVLLHCYWISCQLIKNHSKYNIIIIKIHLRLNDC